MKVTGAQLLGLLGVLGSLFWLSLNTLFSADFGYPGSADYLGYETISRLWAPAFALILCGYLGLYQRYTLRRLRRGRISFGLIVIGLVAMIVGNVLEFWFFSDQAYAQINGRNLSWMGVLLGLLAMLIGLLILGLGIWNNGLLPRWSGLVFILALPLTWFMIALKPSLMGMPFIVAGATVGALAAWPQPVAGVRQETA
jgi:hypothetical protein